MTGKKRRRHRHKDKEKDKECQFCKKYLCEECNKKHLTIEHIINNQIVKEIEENKYKGTDNAKDKDNEEAKKSETENKEEVRNKEKENEKIKKKETDAKMEEEKMHTIYLGVNIDNKYIYPFLVYITSLMDNRGPYTIYDINII